MRQNCDKMFPKFVHSYIEEAAMRYASGETRVVIVAGRYAIKIARIRPLRPILRIVLHLFGKKVKQELLTFDKKMAKGCIRYVIPGIFANRAEALHSAKYSESGLIAPTIFSFLWLVNIQRAGEPATQDDIEKTVLYQRFGSNPDADMQRTQQYCVIGTEVLLSDYGQIEAGDFISLCCQ